MFKAIKKVFRRGGRKESKEEKEVLVENEEVKFQVKEEEEFVQKPYCTEDRVEARFVEEFDRVGNSYLTVKPPAIWYPNTHTDDFGWFEESTYNSKKFHEIWQWIEPKDLGWYPYEDEGENDYCFADEERRDPKPRLSVRGQEVMKNDRMGDWLEKTSRQKFAAAHYDMDGFEKEWHFYDDFEWAEPDDEVGLRVTVEDLWDEDWISTNY